MMEKLNWIQMCIMLHKTIGPDGEIGRRAGFRDQFSQESAGSTPVLGTRGNRNQLIISCLRFCFQPIKEGLLKILKNSLTSGFELQAANISTKVGTYIN